MDKIPTGTTRAKSFERAVLAEQDLKKKFFGSFFEIAGATVSIFIVLAVILITTTDIHICTFEDFAGFTLDFFLLLFCAYAMYINSADIGMRAGLKSDVYKNALEDFNKKKRDVIERKLQARLPDFCYYFIKTELYNTRNAILAIIGFPYTEYEEKWLGKTQDEVSAGELTAGQKNAIIKANAAEPIKLTPEMMMKRGRSGGRRDPLGETPEHKKTRTFVTRFFTTLLTAVITSMIALDAISDPTWTVIVTCIVKLLTIVMNGAMGYKFGYENIVVDTVGYMEDQTDLLRQSIEYCESTPLPQE
ncbi:MAG: hypothetical protein II370_01265 [Clostridia bacterium]|nr:hypothetical protein [Clostridia bacterium]